MKRRFGDLAALPLGHDRNNQNPPVPMIVEGRQAQSNEAPLVDESIVSPEYFHLMDMTLQRGRLFNEFDNDKAEPVALINEAMARLYWPNEDPLGKHVKLSRRATSWTTIVGVVADARTESLEDARIPLIYSSLYQRGAKHLAIFLRGQLDPAAIPDQVREQVQSLDPTLPVFGAELLTQTVSGSLAQRRFALEMVGLFALTALFLAAIGIYGVISYIVTERTHEIGIRLALGAPRSNILRIVLRQGLGLAIVGAAVGLVCSLIVSHLMASLLYGVRPTDPLTFAGVAFLFLGVAVLACYLPARRAMKVDPMLALRYE
jgi:predicted permease